MDKLERYRSCIQTLSVSGFSGLEDFQDWRIGGLENLQNWLIGNMGGLTELRDWKVR